MFTWHSHAAKVLARAAEGGHRPHKSKGRLLEQLERRVLLAGPTMDWSGYLGGSAEEIANGISVDASGSAWVTGFTASSGWTSGGFDTSYNGGTYDAFVVKINANGTLAWSTYLGGSAYDEGYGIAVDADGNAWVTGSTSSTDWASGGFDTSHNGGGNDAFVAKINANGTLAWSSYLGGSAEDRGFDIAVDASGNAWVMGYTGSSDLASGGFDTSYNGGTDAFVAKINANGTLGWSSYLGGSDYEYDYGIAVDADGNAWVAGMTGSSGWASGGFDTSYDGGYDALVAKINANGTLAWSSYLGGSSTDFAFGIAVDDSGNAWVMGQTSSSGWTSGGFDTTYNGGGDGAVAKINADGTLAWSSYLGGVAEERGMDIAVDASGDARVTGRTYSSGWTSGGFDTTYNGGDDGFVGKISDVANNQSPTDITLSASSIAENQPAGTAVGTFSTTDPDVGNTFTYSLVSGNGSTDNAAFTIAGTELRAAASFDYEATNSYSIRVRTTDQGGLWYEKVFTIIVTDVDEIAPTVTAVYVRGLSWGSGYLSFLAANTGGSSATHGYAIPAGTGAAQLQTLPWRNLNQISLRFSEDVSVAQAQFAIAGSVGSYSVSGFAYSSIDHVATWSLSAAIGPDKLYVAAPGSGTRPIVDLAGNVLDGEWSNPSSYSDATSTSVFPSGNGTAGGDFAFRFDVLPGDSTGGSLGKVNVADALQTKGRSSLPVSTSTYRSDFDGNNLVNVADVAYVKSKSSVYSLPVDPPVVPVFGGVAIFDGLGRSGREHPWVMSLLR